MTKTLAPNANADIYIDASGNLAMDIGEQAIEDACKTASLLQLGEAIYQTNLGIPNFQAVWNGTPNIPLFEIFHSPISYEC